MRMIVVLLLLLLPLVAVGQQDSRLNHGWDEASAKYPDFDQYVNQIWVLKDKLHPGNVSAAEYWESLYVVAKHQAKEQRNREVAGLPPPPMPEVDFTPKPPQPRGPGYTDRQFSGHEYEPSAYGRSASRGYPPGTFDAILKSLQTSGVESTLRQINDTLYMMMLDQQSFRTQMFIANWPRMGFGTIY